jgi:predicted TPR repeat methyltransferase
MALTYHHLKQFDNAKKALEKHMSITPSKTIEHMLNALNGITTNSSPKEYVVELFDNYAETFDNHLVKSLKYISPKKISNMIEFCSFAPKPNVLDLGCGTGLVVENLLEKIELGEKSGVDIAPRMIEKAGKKRIYDELICSDIHDFIQKGDIPKFDIITSTDVFIYVGNPERIIQNLGQKMKPNALFCFDFETEDCESFTLRQTGRFAHNPDYMKSLCKQAGLEYIDFQIDNIRYDLGKPIKGAFVIARKQ